MFYNEFESKWFLTNISGGVRNVRRNRRHESGEVPERLQIDLNNLCTAS